MHRHFMPLVSALGIVALSLAAPSMADCELYQEYARVIGEHVGEVYHNGVMIYGTHALTFGYGGQLSVYDLGDPQRPSFDSIVPETGSITAAILEGTIVMAGKRVGQLYYFDSLDIQNLEAPVYHAEAQIPSRAWSLVRSGEYVYMATETGLVIVRVADLDHPTIVASLALGGAVKDVDVESGLACCTVSFFGLVDVDVSNPASPSIVGTYPIPEFLTTMRVIIDGGLAYVGACEGMRILNVVDPAMPVLVKAFSQVPVEGMLLEGSLLYIASSGLAIVDVGTPTDPVVVGRPGSGYLYCLDKAGDMVVTGGNAGDLTGYLQVVDVTVPETVMPAAAVAIPESPWDLVRAGSIVYVASGQLGVQVVDIADPLSPTIVGAVDTPGQAQDIAQAPDHLFVADGEAGLTILDASLPTSPTVVTSLALSGSAAKVLASGSYAYVLTWDDLLVADVSDPANPTIVAEAGIDAPVQDLDRTGSYLLIAAKDQGLHVVDVSDPTRPVIATTIAPATATSEIWGVTALGEYAFLVDCHRMLYTYRGSDLRIYNLADPTSPLEVSVLAVPSLRGPIAVNAGVAYLASDVRLVAVDVSDLAAPVELGAAGSLTAAPAGMVFLEDYVCTVGGQSNYLEVFPRQCSNPADAQAPSQAAWPVTARPNPFARSCTLSFQCETRAPASITIHDAAGRIIRRLCFAERAPGTRTLEWDGCDAAGLPAACGTYFVRTGDSPATSLKLVRLTGR